MMTLQMSKYSITDNSASKPQPAVLPDDAPADWWVELQNRPLPPASTSPSSRPPDKRPTGSISGSPTGDPIGRAKEEKKDE
jgi:hypothetical protein